MTGRYPVKPVLPTGFREGRLPDSGSPENKFIALPFKQQLDLDEITIAEVLKNKWLYNNDLRKMASG